MLLLQKRYLETGAVLSKVESKYWVPSTNNTKNVNIEPNVS